MENRFDTMKIAVAECTVFFSFLRLRIFVPEDVGFPSAAELVRRDISGDSLDCLAQSVSIGSAIQDGHRSVEIQALIDRSYFPEYYSLALIIQGERVIISAIELVAAETALHARSSMLKFKNMIESQIKINGTKRPKLLDIGGRARSGVFHSQEFPDCEVTILDIRKDSGVDVVGDIHAMSHVLARESFDLIICVSVFEHLVMPWKAALEINHVLRPGGLAMIQTHQTVGMHDVPWDYYRFSDACWPGLFNVATGFKIQHTMMGQFVHVVPQHYSSSAPGLENAGGFLESSVIVEKIGPTSLSWPVDLTEVVQTLYPG